MKEAIPAYHWRYPSPDENVMRYGLVIYARYKNDGEDCVIQAMCGYFFSPAFCGGLEPYNVRYTLASPHHDDRYGWSCRGSIRLTKAEGTTAKSTIAEAYPQMMALPYLGEMDEVAAKAEVCRSLAAHVLSKAVNHGRNGIIGRDRQGGKLEAMMESLCVLSHIPIRCVTYEYAEEPDNEWGSNQSYKITATTEPTEKVLHRSTYFNFNSSNTVHILTACTTDRDTADEIDNYPDNFHSRRPKEMHFDYDGIEHKVFLDSIQPDSIGNNEWLVY